MIILLWLIIVGLIIVLPFWKIFTKAGFPGPLAVLMIIPLVNVLMIFFLAFAEWPSLRGRPGGPSNQPPPMT
jgi:TRAP-type C4-dicarboxylate transport system permease small subunit